MIPEFINSKLHDADLFVQNLADEYLESIIPKELSEKIDRIEIPANDPFGIRKKYVKVLSFISLFFYYLWNRVDVYGIENVPNKGSALLISNHGGVVPLDAAHIVTSLIMKKEKPRLVRTLVERFLPTLPFVYTFMSRVGQVVGTYENAEIIVDSGELLQIFPEGAKGATKPYYKYYELEEFNVGFMEIALKKKIPIIPIGVVGSNEQALILFDFKALAKLLKVPNFPITPFWPLMGPFGLMPLPSKYRIIFGAPMDFTDHSEEILEDPEKVKELVEEVRSEVKRLINIGLDMRPAPFL
jgi:1-acyl-sn-glycerol-3-phosphate acyltransferase